MTPNIADGVTPPNNPQATPIAARLSARYPRAPLALLFAIQDLERELAASAREVEALRAEGLRQMAGWIDCAKTVTTLDAENAKLRAELAAAREALQSIADEANSHHEHNPVSGVDRLPLGYCAILVTATDALNPQPGAKINL